MASLTADSLSVHVIRITENLKAKKMTGKKGKPRKDHFMCAV